MFYFLFIIRILIEIVMLEFNVHCILAHISMNTIYFIASVL